MLHYLSFWQLRLAYWRQQLRLLDLPDRLCCLRFGGRFGPVLAVHFSPGHTVLPLRHKLHHQLRRGEFRRCGRKLQSCLFGLRRALRQLPQRSGLHQLRNRCAGLRNYSLFFNVSLRLLRQHQLDLCGLCTQLRFLFGPLDLHLLRTDWRAAVLPLL